MSTLLSNGPQTSALPSAISDNETSKHIVIEFPDTAIAEDSALVHHITTMINRAYDVAEPNYFEPGHGRTSDSEVTQLLRDEKIALAMTTSTPKEREEIVGCAAIYRVSETCATFGMLVSISAIRGSGTGLRLVQFAEHHARDVLHCGIMQLKILLPRI